MCIIAAKPAGIEMPDSKTIRTMWENNSDGAGIMYADGGKVRIEKGFMQLSQLESALERLGKRLDLTATPVVLHFRIRTHGGTVAECTHPFPITDSIGALKKLACRTDLGVAHNGVIHSVDPRPGISDTMEYIATQLAPLKRALPRFYLNKHAMKLVQNAIGSRMVFLTKDGTLHTVGDFVEDGGILYSNTSYKPYNFRSVRWSTYYPGGSMFDHSEEMQEDVLPLCWLDDAGYVEIDGELLDGWEFLIDEQGRVLQYDYEEDAAYYMPGATAYNNANLPAQYDPERADYVAVRM